MDGVKVSVWVVRLRRVGCDPEGPGEEGETRVGRKRIHRIRAPGFGYHFRIRVGRGTGRTAEMTHTEREKERERESVCVVSEWERNSKREWGGSERALWRSREGCVLAPDLLTILQSCPCGNGFSTWPSGIFFFSFYFLKVSILFSFIKRSWTKTLKKK